MFCKKTPFNISTWQAISPSANSAVCMLERVRNKKMVLSVKNIIIPHLATLLNSSAQVLPQRIGCSRSCCDYVQYAISVCVYA